jgi:hypothetical protein
MLLEERIETISYKIFFTFLQFVGLDTSRIKRAGLLDQWATYSNGQVGLVASFIV